jgi:hypothetical protein
LFGALPDIESRIKEKAKDVLAVSMEQSHATVEVMFETSGL